VGGILGLKEQHTKFLNVDFIGLVFLEMPMNFIKDVKYAGRQVIYLGGVKYLCIMYMFVKFLMYEVLISWDLFPLLLVLITFLCSLIIYLSELKL